MTSPHENNNQLPYSKWMPFIIGAAYGIILRLIFTGSLLHGHGTSDVMTSAFVKFTPLAIGAITVYLAERTKRRSIGFYLTGPWLTLLLFVLGTALMLIEGSVCIIMAMPLFMALSSIGGLIMGLVCRLTKYKRTTLNSMMILPLVMAVSEIGQPIPEHIQEIKQSIHINAPAEVIWHHVNFPTNIKPDELKGGFAYMIGVPYPIEARTLNPAVGGKRELKWQRGVHFEEIIDAYDVNRFIEWTYVFTPDSFPAGSLDDHVAIGGKYFNLENTSYRLTPEANGTRLDISVKYRVSTDFNWYAQPWAAFLITDTAKAILKFYKHRAENTA